MSQTANEDDKVTNGGGERRMSPLTVLQGLQLCEEAWKPGDPWDRHGAHAALWGRPAGSFLVVPDSSSQNKLLCVSLGTQYDQHGPDQAVLDFPILLSGSALHLSDSHLLFSDLLQLVAFYTLSRDVLPLCLSVPPWVFGLTEQPSPLLSHLGPKAWLCSSTDLHPVPMTLGPVDSQDTVMCSIQLTTVSGALCIINPLYLHEHGDDWLTHTSASSLPSSCTGNFKKDRRMSTARPWVGAGLKKKNISLDEPTSSSDNSAGSAAQNPVTPITPEGVVLRRSSCSLDPDPVKRVSVESVGSPLPQSPHRVSWVEDKVWLNPAPPLLHLPFLELDSLSVSSIEEEPEAEPPVSPSQSQHLPRLQLADKVKNRLSAVGQALGSLMSPQRRLCKRVQELSQRRGGAFSEAVRGFVEQTLKVSAAHSGMGSDALQDVRAALTGLRETLYHHTEIQNITDTLTELADIELDAVMEIALHKVTLKPVYEHLWAGVRTAREQDGSLQRLESKRDTLAGYSLAELEGTAGVGVPDAATMEKVQQHWSEMNQAYSPNKKVDTLLKVCKSVYHSMRTNACPGVVFGADDFLPCLTWVVLRSDVTALQTDTDYMMELLDPPQLQGESGYYLTSLFAALFYISSFRPRLAARQLSAEAHKSLSQWHRRRTLHCNQSRRSRNRRTFKKHGHGERVTEANKEAGESSSNDRGESADQSTIDTPPASDVTETVMTLAEDLSDVREEEEEKKPVEGQK